MTLVVLAFGVAMDCTAVSAAYALRRISPRDLVKLALTFGSFQAGAALLGALGGTAITGLLAGWDVWIAFGLLLAVGAHMIYEALFEEDRDADDPVDAAAITLPALLALGVATSIDSLAVGATLPTLGLPAFVSSLVIGLVSFVMSFVGAWCGVRAGARFGPAVEILGGTILIALGIGAVWTLFVT